MCIGLISLSITEEAFLCIIGLTKHVGQNTYEAKYTFAKRMEQENFKMKLQIKGLSLYMLFEFYQGFFSNKISSR